LVLDEFREFGRRVLEVMRQLMEYKVVTIHRVKGSLTISANFQPATTMDPYPWQCTQQNSFCWSEESQHLKYLHTYYLVPGLGEFCLAILGFIATNLSEVTVYPPW
jgi:predicted ATPase with chaperone activity